MSSEDVAWAGLEQAIEKFLADLGQPGLLMDWALVTHKLVANDDGSNDMSTTYVGSEFQPMYRTLGLFEYAAETVRQDMRRGNDGDSGF